MAILKHTVVFVGGLVAIGAASGPPYDVDPPTTAPSDTISDCTNWAVATSSDTCQSLAAQGDDISVQQFLNYVRCCFPPLNLLTPTLFEVN